MSSDFGKLLDSIIMELEAGKVDTNELQFDFKRGSSPMPQCLCGAGTVAYFVHRGSNVNTCSTVRRKGSLRQG